MMSQTAGRVVLIADDSPDDRMFTREALLAIAPDLTIREVEDGLQLLDYLAAPTAERPFPNLILLDLKMPRMDGLEALAAIRADPTVSHVPIVAVYTSSADPDSVRRTYAGGANAFVGKPASSAGLSDAMRLIIDHWFGLVSLPPAERAATQASRR